jgi:ATP-dependent DNA helicase RecQ
LWEAFTVPPGLIDGLARVGDEPILLVDDLVDSRWTITVAGRALRQAGAGAVLPFALATVA